MEDAAREGEPTAFVDDRAASDIGFALDIDFISQPLGHRQFIDGGRTAIDVKNPMFAVPAYGKSSPFDSDVRGDMRQRGLKRNVPRQRNRIRAIPRRTAIRRRVCVRRRDGIRQAAIGADGNISGRDRPGQQKRQAYPGQPRCGYCHAELQSVFACIKHKLTRQGKKSNPATAAPLW